jgi:hypothetical protein
VQTLSGRKPGAYGPFGKHKSMWEDNIKMDLQAHTGNSHDSRTTKRKKLTTEGTNGL